MVSGADETACKSLQISIFRAILIGGLLKRDEFQERRDGWQIETAGSFAFLKIKIIRMFLRSC
jgi:hypothetical protein